MTAVSWRTALLGLSCWAAIALLVAAGARILRDEYEQRAIRADMASLKLKVEKLTWVLDQMDHGTTVRMPASMAPGLPDMEHHRLVVEVGVFNDGHAPQTFRVRELLVRSDSQERWAAVNGAVDAVRVRPGQLAQVQAQFDVPQAKDRRFSLVWSRGRVERRLGDVEHPAEHRGQGSPSGVAWPASFSELPPGDAEAGRRLYASRYGCLGCHGQPERERTLEGGPHLRGIGQAAGSRVRGQSAAQYIYESILDPDALIAPTCPDGPCAAPSAMPSYRAVISRKDMVDIVSYLLTR